MCKNRMRKRPAMKCRTGIDVTRRPTTKFYNKLRLKSMANIHHSIYLSGAFLISYLTCAILLGFPMLFVETSLGQFTQRGCLGSWDLVPAFRASLIRISRLPLLCFGNNFVELQGVGYASLMISWYFLSYIMVVMAWILFYLGHSFTLHDLPWATCGELIFDAVLCIHTSLSRCGPPDPPRLAA